MCILFVQIYKNLQRVTKIFRFSKMEKKWWGQYIKLEKWFIFKLVIYIYLYFTIALCKYFFTLSLTNNSSALFPPLSYFFFFFSLSILFFYSLSTLDFFFFSCQTSFWKVNTKMQILEGEKERERGGLYDKIYRSKETVNEEIFSQSELSSKAHTHIYRDQCIYIHSFHFKHENFLLWLRKLSSSKWSKFPPSLSIYINIQKVPYW